MALLPMNAVCTKCNSKFTGIPKQSFLGFQKISCPACKAELTYPLTKGYRTTYWVILGLMIAIIINAFSQGGFGYPGGIGIAVIFALLRDRSIRKRLASTASQTPNNATG
jgi:phage FluMu protein Com